MFTSDTEYCEKLPDDFHLKHLQPHSEILEKIENWDGWPHSHTAAYTPSKWLFQEAGINFFDSIYGKNNWMCLIFRVPPNFVGKLHADGPNDAYNFIVKGGQGCTRWYDESKLTLNTEMQNFTKAEGVKTTRIYDEIEDYVFEAHDKDHMNNHLHICIPHRVFNFGDEERLLITVRRADAGVQEKVDLIDKMLLMQYNVPGKRDYSKPMDVNEWLDNIIAENLKSS